MYTEEYYKKLFTEPLVLTEKEISIIVRELSLAMTKQRYHTVAETVQYVMIQLGQSSISMRNEALIRICYLVSNRTRKVPTDKTVRDMFRCLYGAIKNNPMFTYEIVPEYNTRGLIVFTLNPQCFSCKQRNPQGGCTACKGETCALKKPAECEWFLQKVKNAQDCKSELANSIRTAYHIATILDNSEFMLKIIKQNSKKGKVS